MTEHEALIILNQIQGMGAMTAQRLEEQMGSLSAVLSCSEQALREVPGIGMDRAAFFAAEFRRVKADEEIRKAEKTGVTLLTWEEKRYPAWLKQIADPPLVLYVAGSVEALDTVSVAIVGTRHPTVYGRETARRFGYQLAAQGYTVVSGLAQGIDTEAHTGAVQAKGKTVAVLGGALDCLFPKVNTQLARDIASSGGAVISEYPFGRQPDRQTFPMRNRIVSGLARGVLVVEAPLNSGTLITAGQAVDQNRSVMVVPGRIDSPASQGCHKLLKEGAKLVTSVDDVVEELQDLFAGRTLSRRPVDGTPSVREAVPLEPVAKPMGVVSPEERAILAAIESEGSSVDTLIRTSGLPAGRVSALLVGLQIKRQVRLLPGGMVMRT